MTTSSLTLNALVCLLIAAVRLRSSQNFLRASAETATKPSPPR
jgi:head-tail adaptor